MNKMDYMTNAIISDSGYSNSCSNTQSRTSNSTKSTNSGSHSSGSSGYGGKPSAAPAPEAVEVCADAAPAPAESVDLEPTQPPQIAPTTELVTEVDPLAIIDSSNDEKEEPMEIEDSKELFWCVISIKDGLVLHTTDSITTSLGFPKDMWFGRSFRDLVHPHDRSKFSTLINVVPEAMTTKKGAEENVRNVPVSTIYCRIRHFRRLSHGIHVKTNAVKFTPFMLRLSYKSMDQDGSQAGCLVVFATPFHSGFKVSCEVISNAVPFVVRHSPDGLIDYVSPESIQYLGYLPQELFAQNALHLFHPYDLPYIYHQYQEMMKHGSTPRSNPYRILCRNGDYLRLETEWSTFINPWSKKLEFVIATHYIVEGPEKADVFACPSDELSSRFSDQTNTDTATHINNIIKTMQKTSNKSDEAVKQVGKSSKQCQMLTSILEEAEKNMEAPIVDNNTKERDPVILGGISPHHEYSDESSTETPLYYNQLNYNDNIQRYFESYIEDSAAQSHSADEQIKETSSLIYDCETTASTSSRPSKSSMKSSHGHTMMADGMRLTEAILHEHNNEMEKMFVEKYRVQRAGLKHDRFRVRDKSHFKSSLGPDACTHTHDKKRKNVKAKGYAANDVQDEISPMDNMPSTSTANQNEKTLGGIRSQLNDKPFSLPDLTGRRRNFINTKQATPQCTSDVVNTAACNRAETSTRSVQYMMCLQPQIPYMYYFQSTMPHTHSNIGAPHSPPAKIKFVLKESKLASSGEPKGRASGTGSDVLEIKTDGSSYSSFGSSFFKTDSGSNEDTADSKKSPPSSKKCQDMKMKWSDSNDRDMDPRSMSTSLKREPPGFIILNGPKRFCPSQPTRADQQWDEQGPKASPSMQPNSPPLMNQPQHMAEIPDYELPYMQYPQPLLGFPVMFLNQPMVQQSTHSKYRMDNKNNMASKDNSTSPTDLSSYSSDLSVLSLDEIQHRKQTMTSSTAMTKTLPKRNTVPPWMAQVTATHELVHTYQLTNRKLEDVLASDKEKIASLKQSVMVNDQLEQLYKQLQLEGSSTRLTLDKGITSSSSSNEEGGTKQSVHKRPFTKVKSKRYHYSKLSMIYEEDAPMPSGTDEETKSGPDN